MTTSQQNLDGVSSVAVGLSPSTFVEVVVLPWPSADAAGERDRFVRSVQRLRAAGVDVVLTVDGGQQQDTADLLADPVDLPGRAVLWSVERPEVRQVAPGNGNPLPAAADDPTTWARRWLAGPSAPATVLHLTDPSPAVLEGIAALADGFPQPVDDPAWRLDVSGFDTGREPDVESWFTVANGRSGTRGALEERSPDSAAGFYIAGIFGCPASENAVPQLVRGPEWTRLHPRAGGGAVDLCCGEILDHRRVLDLRQAILLRDWRQSLPTGEDWRFRSARFASQSDRSIMALEAEAGIDEGRLALTGDIPMPHDQPAAESVVARGPADQLRVSVEPMGGANHAAVAVATREHEGRLERIVAVDQGPRSDGHLHAGDDLRHAEGLGLPTLRARHRRAWRDRWRGADIAVDGFDAELQRAVRFALYHLISSGDPDRDLASIGARGLTGPGYGGRVFWDTEIFLLPFFIWTHPPTARALLSYRHRTLPAARDKARRLGYDGALYAWESADTGEDATPTYAELPDGTRLEIVTGTKEHHISADVAWAVSQYWLATGDDGFLVTTGAEIVLETARFWASRAEAGVDGRSHITDLVGPDEYHEGVDDNAFTNVMARWNLLTALELCERVPALDQGSWDDLVARIGLQPGEPDRWREVAAGLVDGFDPSTQLYEQFAGFSDLEDIRAVDLAPRPFGGEMVLGVERLRQSQVVKQADVVMLAHVLPEVMPGDVALANYRHYEPRTSHGSSLSPAIHSAVAARLGLLDDGVKYFRMAALLDLDNKMGNAAHGVHIATMGGLWQAAVVGFGGVRAEREALRIDPHLPAGWRTLSFTVQWHGTTVHVEATEADVTLQLDGPATVAVGPGGSPTGLGPGSVVVPSDPSGV
jgi:kojibiose phosphorylase